ncbi:MAG: hypothetical protein GEU68_04845 [Actinobacteria bacterium]|nr:hypothetical protein [Actinomycetota bacterium]
MLSQLGPEVILEYLVVDDDVVGVGNEARPARPVERVAVERSQSCGAPAEGQNAIRADRKSTAAQFSSEPDE